MNLRKLFFINKSKFSIYFAILIANIGLSGLYPIIPIYIKSMGGQNVALWSGFIVGVPFLLSALMGPIWSRLAQLYGFRTVLSIQSLFVCISLLFQAFAKTPLELFFIRSSGNFFAGIISSLFSYIAFSSPKEEIGKNLTYGSIASSIGFIVGPGLLGIVASSFNFQMAFYVSAILLFLCFILNVLTLPNHVKVNQSNYTLRDFFSKLFGDINNPKVQKAYFLIMILFTFLSIPTTLEGLFAVQVLQDASKASLWVGSLSTVGATLGLVLSYYIGKYVDSVGYRRIFEFILGITALAIILFGFSSTLISFSITFCLNIVLQCEFNTLANLLVIDYSKSDHQSQAVVSTFSIIKIGTFLGAALAGSMAEIFSINAVIIFSGVCIFIVTILIKKKVV